MKTVCLAWALRYPNGSLSLAAFRKRSEAMEYARARHVSASDYHNKSLSENWKAIKRRGHRIVRVRIIAE